MRLIFLDIDGVMNHIHHKEKSRFHQGYSFCPNAVKNLKRIIKETDAYIVVSSSWRGNHSTKVLARKLFTCYGLSHRIVGRTPKLKKDHIERVYRGEEIRLFLARFNKPVESFIILDDDNDMLELTDRLVRTSPFNYGLTLEKTNEAIELLLDPQRKASEDSFMGWEYHKQYMN